MEHRTRELAKGEWDALLPIIAKAAEGLRVRVEVIGRDTGDQVVADHVALRGLGLESHGEQERVVGIMLGGEDVLDHRVVAPERIYLQQTPGGALICLDIEAPNGRTLIFFEQPLMLPQDTGAGAPAP